MVLIISYSNQNKIGQHFLVNVMMNLMLLFFHLLFVSGFRIELSRVVLKRSAQICMNLNTNDLRIEALSKFVKDCSMAEFTPTTGGVNNIMDYVTLPSGEKYVLRIYNNGLNSKRVEFEHRILDALQETASFSFSLPTAIKSIQEKSTHVVLSNGAEASLFEFIPGALPKKTCVKEIGSAAGNLVTALGKINIPLESPNPAYYDLYRAHHAISKDLFYKEFDRLVKEASDDVRNNLYLLGEELHKIDTFLRDMLALNPPLSRQLIHGDLHYDNVLCENGKVTGLLDFEFCAYDWRAMELAVCLSKYADQPSEALEIFRQFIEGFCEEGRLQRREVEILPELIILRILSNVVYFMGRAIAGEDGYESLTSRAGNYYSRIAWITQNRQKIIDLIPESMIE